MNATVIGVSGGDRMQIGPTVTVVKVPGALTAGRFGVVEMHVPADFAGPPPHVHRSVDHLWGILDGTLDLLLDGRCRRAGAGDLALVPAGTVHAFSTAAGGPAVLLEVDIGRALDGYFRELREAIGAGPVASEVVERVMARHDTMAVLP